MKRSTAEFGVYRVFIEDEHLIVDGRCFDRPLSVGDVFRQVYQSVPDRPITEPGWRHVASDFRRIELRIEKIICYGHSLSTLDPGYTARLVLSGIGRDLVRNNHDEVLGVELPEN